MGERRIYVMDCGDFVKIGVSINLNRRKDEIPHEIKQYYSTKPIENPFKIEKFMHSALKPLMKSDVQGREYFNIDFDVACDFLNNAIIATEDRREKVLDCVEKLQETKGINNDFYSFMSKVMILTTPDLGAIAYFAEGLAIRRLLLEKECEDEEEKQLQEVNK